MNNLKELHMWTIVLDRHEKMYCIMGYISTGNKSDDFDLIREPIIRIDFEEKTVSTEKEIYKLAENAAINMRIQTELYGEFE